MRVMTVVGTRPEAIKMALVIKSLEEHPALESIVCASGQHRQMLDQVLDLFSIKPDIDLNVMKPGQALNDLASNIMREFDSCLDRVKPDIVLTHGDTTTAFVASIACFHRNIAVGHVEAGLRTYDMARPFPEELNRRAIDLVSTYLFAPTERSRQNLLEEKADANKIYVTGNTVVDALKFIIEKIDSDRRPHQLGDSLGLFHSNRRLVLVTGHRRESFGAGFERICHALARIAQRDDVEIVYPVHLNPNVADPVRRALHHFPNVHLIPPIDYLTFVYLLSRASAVITDSGGVQEEAASLGKRVLVMRDKTERPEGVEAGLVQLVGTDSDLICTKLDEILETPTPMLKVAKSIYGDGKASARIVAALAEDLPAHARCTNRALSAVPPNIAAGEPGGAQAGMSVYRGSECAPPQPLQRLVESSIRAEVLGAPVDILSMEDTVSRARAAMREKRPIVQVSLNVAKLVDMRRNAELRQDVLASDIINADGMGVVMAGRLLGLRLRNRVAGIDLMMALLELCAGEGFRPYFLGATPEVLQHAAAAAVERFPGLRLAGTHHGYFGPEQESAVIEAIAAAEPDCLFVGMPTPRKERFLRRQRGTLHVPFVMGVGGSFDVLAGKVRRAPTWMQSRGLEWAYRLYQEPSRMWWRYARTNAVFGFLLLQALMRSNHPRLSGGGAFQ